MKLRRTRGFILLPLVLLIISAEGSQASSKTSESEVPSKSWAHRTSDIGSKTPMPPRTPSAIIRDEDRTASTSPPKVRTSKSILGQKENKLSSVSLSSTKGTVNNDARKRIQAARFNLDQQISTSKPKQTSGSQHSDSKDDKRSDSRVNQYKRYLPVIAIRNTTVNLPQENVHAVEISEKRGNFPKNAERSKQESNGQSSSILGDLEPSSFLKNVGKTMPRIMRKAHNIDFEKHNQNHEASDHVRYRKKSAVPQEETQAAPAEFDSTSSGLKNSRDPETRDLSQKEPIRRLVRLRYKSRPKQTSGDVSSSTENEILTSTQASELPKRDGRRGLARDFSRDLKYSTEEPNLTSEKTRNEPLEIRATTAPTHSRRPIPNIKPTLRNFETTSKKAPELDQNFDSKKSNKSTSRYRDNLNPTDFAPVLSSTSVPNPRLRTTSKYNVRSQDPRMSITTQASTTGSSSSLNEAKSSFQLPIMKDQNMRIDRNDRDGEFEIVSTSNLRQRASKEDFFNHGLGFRGRRPPSLGTARVPAIVSIPTSSTATPVPATTVNPVVASRVTPGWTLRRRPDYSRDASSADHPASPVESTVAVGLIDDQTRLTTAASSKNLRRGNKTFVGSSDAHAKVQDGDNSDNYPPEFKARLDQSMKNGEKNKPNPETSRALTAAEAFAARSRMKLENARRLIKPELLIDESKAHHVFAELPDSAVEEGQTVYKLAPTASPGPPAKSDWRPKGKAPKAAPSSASRYKQSALVAAAPRFAPSVRPRETQRSRGGPKASQQQPQRAKDPAGPESREAEVRAVALKLRRGLEALGLSPGGEQASKGRPPRRSDSADQGSTTLLTTMRTVRSFSFSTRLARPDEDSASAAPPATSPTPAATSEATTGGGGDGGGGGARQMLVSDARGRPVLVVYPSATEGPFPARPPSHVFSLARPAPSTSTYKNTNSANSLPRPSPNGAAPKFSARYKSAETSSVRPMTSTDSSESSDLNTYMYIPSIEKENSSDHHYKVETTSEKIGRMDFDREEELGRNVDATNPTNIQFVIENNSSRNNESEPGTKNLPSSLTDQVPISTPIKIMEEETTTTQSENVPENFKDFEPSPHNNTDSRRIFYKEIDIEDTTATSMSTSTELITEVSVSLSDNIRRVNSFSTVTPQPSDYTEVTSLHPETIAENITSSEVLGDETLGSECTSCVNKTEGQTTVNVIAPSTFDEINDVDGSDQSKILDDDSEVSNLLPDIVLQSGNDKEDRETSINYQTSQGSIEKLESRIESDDSTTHQSSHYMSENIPDNSEKLNDTVVTDASKTEIASIENEVEVADSSKSVSSSSESKRIDTGDIDINMNLQFGSVAAESKILLTENASVIPTTSLGSNDRYLLTDGPTIVTQSIIDEETPSSRSIPNMMDVEIKLYNPTNKNITAGIDTSIITENLSQHGKPLPFTEHLLDSPMRLEKTSKFNNSSSSGPINHDERLVEVSATNRTPIITTAPLQRIELFGKDLLDNKTAQSLTDESTVGSFKDILTEFQRFRETPSLAPPDRLTQSSNVVSDFQSSTTNSHASTYPKPIDQASPPPWIISQITQNATRNSQTPISMNAPYIVSISNLSVESTLNNLSPNGSSSSRIYEKSSVNAVDRTGGKTQDLIRFSILEKAMVPEIPNPPSTPSTLLTHLQDSSSKTDPRMANIEAQLNQTYTGLNLTMTRPSSSNLSSITTRVIDQSSILMPRTNLHRLTTLSLGKSTMGTDVSHFKPTSSEDKSTNQQAGSTSSYVGRFGASRLTPVPKFSSSSTTIAPLRDYLIYGIFPNKTIVRKRPEDNLVDSRNIDSPYVILGVYPDGKLVRKFPNGTLVPDSFKSRVEVVYTPNATSTNKPSTFYNPVNNQGTPNQFINHPKNILINDDDLQSPIAPDEVERTHGSSGKTSSKHSIDSVARDIGNTVTTGPSTDKNHKSDKLPYVQKVEEITRRDVNNNGNNQNLTKQEVSSLQDGSLNPVVDRKNHSVDSPSPISSSIMSLIRNPTTAATLRLPSLETTTTSSSVSTTENASPSSVTMSAQTTSSPRPLSTRHSATAVKSNAMALSSNAFGTTFDDLAFLNALLEKPNSNDATPRTLSEAEQMLANKILSLALGKTAKDDGPTRSPKTIQSSLVSPNTIEYFKNFNPTIPSLNFASSSSQPSVIGTSTTQDSSLDSTIKVTWKPTHATTVRGDLSPILGMASTVTPSISSTTLASQAPIQAEGSILHATTLRENVSVRDSEKATTKATVVITARPATTKRVKSTAQAQDTNTPLAFATNFLQRIFGRNLFTRPTTQRPIRRQKSTTAWASSTTAKYIPTAKSKTPEVHIVHAESSLTPRSVPFPHDVEIKNGFSSTEASPIDVDDQVVKVTPKVSEKTSSSTFSPEDDAKFLAALLKHTQSGYGVDRFPNEASKLASNDEEILRALLSDENKIQITPGSDDPKKDSTLLATLLKNQSARSPIQDDLVDQPPQLNQNPDKSMLRTTKEPSTSSTTTSATTRRTQSRPSKSTYPSPLFSNFLYSGANESEDFSDESEPRNQIIESAIGMTRAFGRFIGSVIMGATQRFQSFLRNRTNES